MQCVVCMGPFVVQMLSILLFLKILRLLENNLLPFLCVRKLQENTSVIINLILLARSSTIGIGKRKYDHAKENRTPSSSCARMRRQSSRVFSLMLSSSVCNIFFSSKAS